MRRHRTGFFLADAIMGLVLLGILISVSRDYTRVGSRLSQHADAVNRAQGILQQLHARETVLPAPDVSIRRLAFARTPEGFQWTQVSIQTPAGLVSLTGLVPVELPQEGARP